MAERKWFTVTRLQVFFLEHSDLTDDMKLFSDDIGRERPCVLSFIYGMNDQVDQETITFVHTIYRDRV